MRIRMSLLSDSLAGSGEAFAGTVDRDIAFDERGLPFIPARRIRGILRESMDELEFLEIVESGTTKSLFGVPGDSISSPFRIHDGRIENAETLASFLDRAQATETLATFFSPRFVLEHFTYLRTQTSVENGVAKENTLRISRVLKKGQTFFFDAECPLQYRKALDAACAGVRSFGSSRNRGLGAIRLCCEETPEKKEVVGAVQSDGREFEDGPFEMRVSVRALSRLIASDGVGESDDSGACIPGGFLLGALAARYLSIAGNSASSPSFLRIFLSGETIWSNLHPVPKEDSSKEYAPAPLSVRKVKNTDDYIDLAVAPSEEMHKGMGELFLAPGGEGFYYGHRPRMSVQYHHRRAEDRAYGRALNPEAAIPGDKGAFFQFQVMEGEQCFKGSIVGSFEDLKTVESLLPPDRVLRLGKSRAAQYGKCRVSFSSPSPLRCESDEEWEDEETLLFRLLSDAILLNEYGHPEPNCLLLAKEVARILGVSAEGIVPDEERIFIRKRFVGGCLGVWNLPRIQYPALAAGSVVALKNVSGQTLDMEKLNRSSVGLRIADGFGRLAWKNLEGLEQAVTIEREKSLRDPVDHLPEEAMNLVNGLRHRFFLKNLIKDARDAASSVSILPGSFIGRLSAIVRDSTSFGQFNGRIQNFKGKPAGRSLKKIAEKLFIDKEKLAVEEKEEKKFGNRCAQFDPVAHSATLRSLCPGNVEATYDDYREYAVAFLSSLKLKVRSSGS